MSLRAFTEKRAAVHNDYPLREGYAQEVISVVNEVFGAYREAVLGSSQLIYFKGPGLADSCQTPFVETVSGHSLAFRELADNHKLGAGVQLVVQIEGESDDLDTDVGTSYATVRRAEGMLIDYADTAMHDDVHGLAVADAEVVAMSHEVARLLGVIVVEATPGKLRLPPPPPYDIGHPEGRPRGGR